MKQMIFANISGRWLKLTESSIASREKSSVPQRGNSIRIWIVIHSLRPSRGCPYHFTFCTVHLTMGKKVRARSAQSVADELAYWQEQGHDLVQVNDDMFGFRRELLEEICELVQERKLTIKMNLTNGNRTDHMDYALLSLLKSANVTKVVIGVEGGNDRMLDILCKAEKMEVIEQGISVACDLWILRYNSFTFWERRARLRRISGIRSN